MDEFQTILKARQFIGVAGNEAVPVDIKHLATAADAKIKIVYNLAEDESGQTARLKGKHLIIVNGNHREERQRFTVLHEIAHIVMGLPSQHHGTTLKTDVLLRYRQRPEEEILCDVFAAECLLPYDSFAKEVADTNISLDAVKSLAAEYKASLTTTGSRFAANTIEPCAFVLSEDGWIRYVSRSKYLRELKGWIEFNIPVPEGSVAHRLMRGGAKIEDHDEISTDVWFGEGFQNRQLVSEEAIVLQEWNQCLSLIWFDESRKPTCERWDEDEDNESLLKELDGTLPWPSKSRRR